MSINIQKNILLSSRVTFKIGGFAKYFCEVKSVNDLAEAVEFTKKNNIDFFILGGGSNILVSDNGFNGLVIHISSSSLNISGNIIEADAGVPLGRIVLESINNGLKGMEWAAGVPGTLGGAIRGNAGCFGGEMKDVIINVKAVELTSGKVSDFNNGDCSFFYRESLFKRNRNFIIWSASLLLQNGNIEELKNRIKFIMDYRSNRQHIDMPSAGSIFKNIRDESGIKKIVGLIPDIKNEAIGLDGSISVAYLIDRCGLKGTKVGGAMISPKQANFIVNFDNAKAEDVIILMGIIKERVMVKFGALIEPEIQLVGFDNN